MNQKLGSTARQEIRTAMTGLDGTSAKAEAVRLAADHKVSWQYIYGMTRDLRHGKRKTRSDAGRRTFELVPGTDVFYAASLVIYDKVDPGLALLIAKGQGYTNLPSLEYFRKLLADSHLGKKERRNPVRAFRRWEAEYPGEIFQIDVTALKERWRDEKTRRIMKIVGVDKNHPMEDPTKQRVWQILLKDDHSRRVFLRYFVARAITSAEMVRFMCEAYSELGVPQKLYTDQGGEFKSRHTKAAIIFNSLPTIRDTGGYEHMPHKAGNAQATGKVENGHQWAEKMDGIIGVATNNGDRELTIEILNDYARQVCDNYNNRVHRVTKETPMFRWTNKRIVVRKFDDPKIIESALLSDEFDALLDPSMTITRDGVAYRIPSIDPKTKEKAPFVDYVSKWVKVVIPPSIDTIVITLPGPNGKFEPVNGGVYDIDKVIATADKAGDFKGVAESSAEDLKKQLKAFRKENIRLGKDKQKETGQIAPLPYLDYQVEQPSTNVMAFPHTERVVTRDEIAAVVPMPQTVYEGKPITYWQAIVDYSSRFDGGVEEAKTFLLGAFPGTAGTLPAPEVEAAIERRYEVQRPRLQAVS